MRSLTILAQSSRDGRRHFHTAGHFCVEPAPTRFAAVVLILASFVLFALEAKFATHGVLAIGGIVTLTLGGLLLVDAPIPEMRVHL